jgi:hypothetical protein
LNAELRTGPGMARRGRITGNPEVILDRLKSRRFTNCR